jgi:hypothetical protein
MGRRLLRPKKVAGLPGVEDELTSVGGSEEAT